MKLCWRKTRLTARRSDGGLPGFQGAGRQIENGVCRYNTGKVNSQYTPWNGDGSACLRFQQMRSGGHRNENEKIKTKLTENENAEAEAFGTEKRIY